MPRLIKAYADNHIERPFFYAALTDSDAGAIAPGTSTTKVTNANLVMHYNIGNCWDTTNSRFIAPVTGLYRADFWTIHRNVQTGILQIYKNTVLESYSHPSAPSNQWGTSALHFQCRLLEGEYFEWKWANSSGGEFYSDPYSGISAHMIG